MKVNYKFIDKIKQIVNSNCKEIPYEGTEVNKESVVSEVCELVNNLEPKEEVKETWDEIFDEFTKFERGKIGDWLKENYNVPTKLKK